MLSTSTSLTVFSPRQRPVQRREGALQRRIRDTDTGFEPGLPTPKDEVIDVEFYELMAELADLPPENHQGYEAVITPQYLFKSRYVNYYA